jgi:hypothetical protein
MVYPHVEYRGPAYPVQTHDDTVGSTRELDSRTSDGIHVRLLWHPRDGQVSVAVNDEKTGDYCELRVEAGQNALDVFHHPYAYAAMRRLPVAAGVPVTA